MKLQLKVGFRFIKKSGLSNWTNYDCCKRRVWATLEYVVSYQNVTQDNIAAAKRKIANARLPVGWFCAEMPLGFYAELSPVFMYKEVQLQVRGQSIGLLDISGSL